MGNKSSKSVNISTPKGNAAVDENNHVGNGDSGKPEGNRILEDAKEQVKDLMKDIANEAVKKSEEVIGDVGKEMTKDKTCPEDASIVVVTESKGAEGEPPVTTPKDEKKKVQKKRSFRRFSFLRKEKKAKEDKPKQNGSVEPNEGEKAAEQNTKTEENGSAIKDDKNEIASDAVKAVPETETSEVNDIKVENKVVEQVQETVTSGSETKIEEVVETKIEEAVETKIEEVVETKIEEVAQAQELVEKLQELPMIEKVEYLVDSLSKLEVKDNEEMTESVEDKSAEPTKPKKESIGELTTEEPITNGTLETNGHEVAVE